MGIEKALTLKSDIFALGITLMTSVLGNYYGFDDSEPELKCSSKPSEEENILNWALETFHKNVDNVSFRIEEGIIVENLEFFDLLFNMLQLKPEDRYTIEKVMSHGFFSGNLK